VGPGQAAARQRRAWLGGARGRGAERGRGGSRRVGHYGMACLAGPK
jgi:hypothetical protein